MFGSSVSQQFRVVTAAGTQQGRLQSQITYLGHPTIIEHLRNVLLNAMTGRRLPITQTYTQINAVMGIQRYDAGEDDVILKVMDKNPTLGPWVISVYGSGIVQAHADFTIHGYYGALDPE